MDIQPQHYDLVATTQPYKCYIKRILGQVYVNILNPYDETKITGLILKGNPRAKDNKTCIIKIWSKKQDDFFKELNSRHFEAGRLIEIPIATVVKAEEEKVKPYTEYSDDELLDLLKTKYAELSKIVAGINEQAVLGSLVQLAEEHDKSKRIVTLLQSRLSELQEVSYNPNMVIEK